MTADPATRRPSLSGLALAPLRLGYAAWAIGTFLVVGFGALLLLVVLPREHQRDRKSVV